jgi:hypothetical protein
MNQITRFLSWLNLGCHSEQETVVSQPLSPKDPLDWSLTASSTAWATDEYCPQCHATIGHSEIMANICNTCGHHGGLGINSLAFQKMRSFRRIWDGDKWVWQYKYGNTLREMKFSEKALHSKKR